MPDRAGAKGGQAPMIAFVVARARNGVIGDKDSLPWRLPGDLKHFRALTIGKPVIMGRKTYASIGKPLEGRDNIVITRDPDFSAPGIHVAYSAKEAITAARQFAQARGVNEIMVIGGAQIYDALLDNVERIYLTEIHADIAGDTQIAPFGPGWSETQRQAHCASEKDSHDYSFVTLERQS